MPAMTAFKGFLVIATGPFVPLSAGFGRAAIAILSYDKTWRAGIQIIYALDPGFRRGDV